MNAARDVEEKLRDLGRRFPPRPELADRVMGRIDRAPAPQPRIVRRWLMRSAIGIGVAACVTLAVLLVSPTRTAQGFDLPPAGQLRWQALGELRDYDIDVTPSISPYEVRPDLSNVQGAGKLDDLTAEQRKLLAANCFLILPSASQEFYEVYYKNPAPFVTSDSVLHAYHVLLAEALRQGERHYLAAKQAALARAGYGRMKEIASSVPDALKPAAGDALAYWAVAASLAEPELAKREDLPAAARAELERIRRAKFIGRVEDDGPKRDYTLYEPTAGYEKDQTLRRYFVLNRYFTLATQPFDTDRDARACMLIALAVGTSDKAREAYLDLARYRELLGGLGEDPTPITLLAAARETFGGRVTHAALARPESLGKLRQAVAAQPRPQVADQPQSVPGADPLAGYGMRMFPPGVSVRAIAFQSVAEATARTPRGEHVAGLLGTEMPAVRDDVDLLKAARAELGRRRRQPARQDVHTSMMLALERLSGERGKGYPSFLNGEAWRIKTANTQMGAWSEIEHDLCLYLKDNALYCCAVRLPKGFHGYVEPVPGTYAALAALSRRTGEALEQLGLFRRISAALPARPDDARAWYRPPVAVTKGHFQELTSLLLALRDMAAKELRNETFDKEEIELLKRFGPKLKHLAFNDSTSPDAREPMSVIVRIAREYLEQKGRYVGVGRPLRILVVVPYGGELHWALGGVYSYYQFDRPLRQPLTDRQWKHLTAGPLATQPYQPWLTDKAVGLNAG